ncbi:MAG: methyl-accepting chemotaxis protein [Nitrospirota bacterium]
MHMHSTVRKLFQEGILGAIIHRIASSMWLKFMIVLTVVISVFLVLNTILIMRVLTEGQYAVLEKRGHDMGRFFAKAITDPLLHRDYITVNGLVREAAESPDMLYVYVTDASQSIISTAYAAFNRTRPDMKAFLDEQKTDDMVVLVEQAKEQLNPFLVEAPVQIGKTRLGTVVIGLSHKSVQDDTRQVMRTLGGTSVVIIGVLIVMMSILVRRMIVSRTTEAVTVVSDIAAGDLSHRVRVQTRDELGMLGQGLNSMILGLKGMIDGVQRAAEKTESLWKESKQISKEIASGSRIQTDSVGEASSSINEMHFSLREIAANVDDLHGTSEQTASSVIEMAASTREVAATMTELSSTIEQTSAAITELSAAVRRIAENVEALSTTADDTAASAAEISASVREVETNARESAALAEEVAEDAQQLGMRSIEKTIQGMNRINAAVRRTADVINRLGDRAENIGSILTVIEDITDQTALLALNAAILAAQAGEHGKGFAVVAAEIRELANRTAVSTKEIGKLIMAVQEESREAVGVTREEISMVEDGVRLARDAGEALQKILERANLSRDMSRSINKAAAEQARGIRQVSDAVSKITHMTHQIAHAANEQKIGSEQITQASVKMRELTGFVKMSTDAQAKGSKEITAAVENMSTKIGLVNRAVSEVQTGSDLIVQAIARIKEIATAHMQEASRLDAVLEVMVAQSEALKKEIERFKT